jgi:hypothetical protein
MFQPSAVVARQWKLKHVSVDMLDSPAVLDGHGNQEWNNSTIRWEMLSIGAAKCYIGKTQSEVRQNCYKSVFS